MGLPSNKTLSKIVTNSESKNNVQSVFKSLIHQNILSTFWKTERKTVSFLLSHLFRSNMLQFLDGKTEIVNHVSLCVSPQMQTNVTHLGINFLKHHDINTNTSTSL